MDLLDGLPGHHHQPLPLVANRDAQEPSLARPSIQEPTVPGLFPRQQLLPLLIYK